MDLVPFVCLTRFEDDDSEFFVTSVQFWFLSFRIYGESVNLAEFTEVPYMRTEEDLFQLDSVGILLVSYRIGLHRSGCDGANVRRHAE